MTVITGVRTSYHRVTTQSHYYRIFQQFFKRLILKRGKPKVIGVSLYRAIGKTKLILADLEKVLIDVLIILITDSDYLILTPNSFILGSEVNFPNEALYESESETMK